MKIIKLLAIICLWASVKVSAQTLTDGLLMPKNNLCTGFTYTVDSWRNYWEGSLKRDNLNIGTITTKNVMWVANYGLTEKLNLIAMVPYVWTNSNSGTLRGMQGVQDLTLAGKYKFFQQDLSIGKFKAFGIVSGSVPLTNYVTDYQPLAIGMGSKTLSARLNLSYAHAKGWYAGVSGSYVMRSNVTIDRTSYYRGDHIIYSNKVSMPNQFMLFANAGYQKNNFQAELNYSQLNTLSGDDIRRQNMPELWSKMIYFKLGATLVYEIPMVKGLQARANGYYTLAGRNVGQSTTLTAGLLYTIQFKK
ncbi:MAG TPA: hypothetical protein DGG95_01960 [Cytophagales bacterium]|jgi:hypothetical protein|nr:hypothetical protein [Cytophagales bacterium]